MSGIVVGIDGSHNASRALEWAMTEAGIRKVAEDAVAKVAEKLGSSRPESVTVTAVNGFPARTLIEASKDCDLMVVGSRGGGGFAPLVLGSVSDQVVHHASCPVVVVPASR